jgi:hypothetical protein
MVRGRPGYEPPMKFKLGLAIGLAAGYWYGSLPEEERRQKVEEAMNKVRANPRVTQVTDTVSRNVAKVTDAVESRVTQAADKAGDAVASTAAPHENDDVNLTTPPSAPSTRV